MPAISCLHGTLTHSLQSLASRCRSCRLTQTDDVPMKERHLRLFTETRPQKYLTIYLAIGQLRVRSPEQGAAGIAQRVDPAAPFRRKWKRPCEIDGDRVFPKSDSDSKVRLPKMSLQGARMCRRPRLSSVLFALPQSPLLRLQATFMDPFSNFNFFVIES